jgi:hypothetical protein
MLIERMLHNSASVMLRQKEEDNIPDYPLFTHEEIDRLAAVYRPPFGKAKKFAARKDEIEIIFHPPATSPAPPRRDPLQAAPDLHHRRRAVRGSAHPEGREVPAGHFDTLIMETTRGTTERPVGKERVHEIARLVTSINDTIQRGGSFLLPVFALGRMQEILSVMHDARKFGRLVDCPIYAAGLGMGSAEIFRRDQPQDQARQFNRGS